MTSPMDTVRYDSHDFLLDPRQHRPPPSILPERHVFYSLLPGEGNALPQAARDAHGRLLSTPRRLRDICVHRLALDPGGILHRVDSDLLPSNIFPLLLTEAISLREPLTIEWTVSRWPMRQLVVYDVIPYEDLLDPGYLTQPLMEHMKTSLADCFVLGLLKLRPEANLRFIDFTGFGQDRKLSKELSRLPLLWMLPSERTVEHIHKCMTNIIDVTKDKVERFLNRISVVYSNIDADFIHGNQIEPITVKLDLHMTLDDVPLGLSLQPFQPFKFDCSRLWMRPIEDVWLRPNKLGMVIDRLKVTEFEYGDKSLSSDTSKMADLLDILSSLTSLQTLSIPECIDLTAKPQRARDMNNILRKMKKLRRLNLNYCNLKGLLRKLLDGLTLRLDFLSLKDCRLTGDDLSFLNQWSASNRLRELNLSRNNDLGPHGNRILQLMGRMSCRLVAFSASYCSLPLPTLRLIAARAAECADFKALSIQGYIPLELHTTVSILEECARIPGLQKLLIFPEVYAFPGDNDWERAANKQQALRLGYSIMASQGKPLVTLE